VTITHDQQAEQLGVATISLHLFAHFDLLGTGGDASTMGYKMRSLLTDH
jgi:hypothetical protein